MPCTGWKAKPWLYCSMYPAWVANSSPKRAVISYGSFVAACPAARNRAGVRQDGLEFEDPPSERRFYVIALLGKDLVHPVVSHGHRHSVRRVGVPDRTPG